MYIYFMENLAELFIKGYPALILLFGVLVLLKNYGGLLLIGKETSTSEKTNKKHAFYLGVVLMVIGGVLIYLNSGETTVPDDPDSPTTIEENQPGIDKNAEDDKLTTSSGVVKEPQIIITKEEKRPAIHGVVFDPNQVPVSGAIVNILSIGSDTTSESGEFEIATDKKIRNEQILNINFRHVKFGSATIPRPYYNDNIELNFEKQ